MKDSALMISRQKFTVLLTIFSNPDNDMATIRTATAVRQVYLYDLDSYRMFTWQCNGNSKAIMLLKGVSAGFCLYKNAKVIFHIKIDFYRKSFFFFFVM